MPALDPPEVQMDPELVKKYEQEIEAAKNAPLPEEDDDFCLATMIKKSITIFI
ncbi:GTP-binding nuclear spi1 [Brachionus plicatilis]|uniref:GTP-binding nuclear spi1 n=1 Tax=Brachionus plicatilis TaxID=10195 RepID=A0A3M7QZF2_BRAPC|nr:GTP-binding nuclear spi1 [Brachionus plicatilis]